MPLDAFAVSTDVAARLGQTLTPVQEAQVDAFLEDASALLRDYMRQDISFVSSDVMNRTSPDGPWLRLPQLPVITINEVSVNGQVVADWTLIGSQLYRVFGWQWPSISVIPPNAIYGLQSTVQVIYDHGYTQVPAVIKTACVNMVMRGFTNPHGSRSVGLDDYTESWSTLLTGTAVYLSAADMAACKRYRKAAFAIDQGSGVW